MKARTLLAALLLMAAGLQTVKAQKMIVRMTGNQIAEFRVSQVEEVIFTEDEPINDETHGVISGHEWVDLGLPSGTLWATCNVGASYPEEYGDYFAWGETKPKSTYLWETYKYYSVPATIILTCGDVWGDGSGYQMLLDAHATAYGSIIPATGALTTSGDVSAEAYAEFEYKIPTNADGALNTQNIVLNNSISIQIPPGIYDWCITNPTSGDRMWIASTNGDVPGRYDNYEFEPGVTYKFTVQKVDSNDGVFLTVTRPDKDVMYGKSELDPIDDAATFNWGSEWQMPSSEQFEELINTEYTSTEWVSLYGVNVKMIKSKVNNNYIYLPAAGRNDGLDEQSPSLVGTIGYYWSRTFGLNTVGSTGTLMMNFDSQVIGNGSDYARYAGLSVRPVLTEKRTESVSRIVLSESSLNLQIGETKVLTATVLPEDAENKTVSWTSSNESIATVSASGLVTAKGEGSCTIMCTATDGSGVKAECAVKVNGNVTTDEHEWVDLGLPSGTLWATCNVGANSPEEYGDYFAWGEIEPKDDYVWSTYKWMNAGQSSGKQINKYTFADGETSACWYDGNGNFIGDGKTELDPEDDAATANWGSGWQMPTIDQMNELVDNCTRVWGQLNDEDGIFVMGPNGNTIFLPAAGYRLYDDSLYDWGRRGHYWSRSLSTGTYTSLTARYLYSSSSGIDTGNQYRYYGRSVRPVRVK